MKICLPALAVAATTVHVTGVAAAAGLLGASAALGAGTTAVSSCGNLSGVSPRYTVVNGSITRLTVEGLPAGCVGSTLSATLSAASGTALAAAGPTAVTTTSLTFPTLTSTPAAGSVTAVRLVAVGP